MEIEKMPGYGYPVLAYWFQYWYEINKWQIKEYKLLSDGNLKWFNQYFEFKPGSVRSSFFDIKTDALAYVDYENSHISSRVSALNLSEIEKSSIKLKVEKAIEAKRRLMYEEELMLTAAKNKFKNTQRLTLEEIILPERESNFKNDLFSQLQEMPYLRMAFVQGENKQGIIYKNLKNEWSKSYHPTKKRLIYAERSKIANAFNLNGDNHWGDTKARIRKELLPIASKLLQLESVKKLLKEAQAKGQKVLISNGYVFWYEDSGNIGWQIKQVKQNEADNALGNTIWKEGTILSKNHGRLVILPYIKENGDYVQGHTKNAPHDGPAKPRVPSEYLELPFEILEDDLMISLFGELKYE